MVKTLSSTSFNRLMFFVLPKMLRPALVALIVIPLMGLLLSDDVLDFFDPLFLLIVLVSLILAMFRSNLVKGDYRKLERISHDCYMIGNVRFSSSEIVSIQASKERVVVWMNCFYDYAFLQITVVSDGDVIEKGVEYRFNIVPKHKFINLITFGWYQKHFDKYILPKIRLENFENIFG